MRKRTYNILGKVFVGHENADLHLDVKLKQSIASPERKYIVIASTGGKWFIPIPVELWPDVQKAVKKLLKGARGKGTPGAGET